MSIVGFINSKWYPVARSFSERQLTKKPARFSLDRANWERSLREPTAFYMECLRFFHQEQLPPRFREHRNYFYGVVGKRRGYGEHPFHTMWYLLLEEFRPANFLEIGVFRGQVISLITLWAQLKKANCEVCGISPFDGAGDSVSHFPQGVDYWTDTLQNFDNLGLPHPKLVRAFSADAQGLATIASRNWDMIYIDGNHDYEVVRQDWEACSRAVQPGGVIILDDAGTTTAYRPWPFLGFRGFPGPSRVAAEVDRSSFREILQVGHNRVFQRIT